MEPRFSVYWTSFILQPRHWSTLLDLKMLRYQHLFIFKLVLLLIDRTLNFFVNQFEALQYTVPCTWGFTICARGCSLAHKQDPKNINPTLMFLQVGDGTTTVTLLAGEFMKQAKPYIEDGINSQIIIRSFRKATAFVSHFTCWTSFLWSLSGHSWAVQLLVWLPKVVVFTSWPWIHKNQEFEDSLLKFWSFWLLINLAW